MSQQRNTPQGPRPSGASLQSNVVIVSGLSGSGKSTALKALEDANYFCIDNMPVPLLPKVIELTSEGRRAKRYAFVIDSRDVRFLDKAGEVIEELEREGVAVQVVFLEAGDDVLVRRYKETRRKHPMSEGGTVREGIAREREILTDLRIRANITVDTSEQTVHTLKALIQERFSASKDTDLQVNVMSFGFKHGLPSECDLVMDVRFLPNPYFVEGMREQSGLDDAVRDFVMSFQESSQFVEHLQRMLEFVLPLYRWEGKSYLTLGIGCTGGQHRSVAISEIISSRLRGMGWETVVRHRDVRIKAASAST